MSILWPERLEQLRTLRSTIMSGHPNVNKIDWLITQLEVGATATLHTHSADLATGTQDRYYAQLEVIYRRLIPEET